MIKGRPCFCLRNCWIHADPSAWRRDFKTLSGSEDMAAQQLHFQLKSWKAGDEFSKESFALRLSCGTSLAAPGLFPGLFHAGSLCVCSHLLPQCLGQRSLTCALGTPAGMAGIGKNRNILIHTNDKPSLLVQMVSTPFIALSISQDSDLKAKWPACTEMNDQDNPKGTNKNPYVKAGTKVLLTFITLLSFLLS